MSRTRRPFAALLTVTLGLLLTSCAARAPLPPPDAATAWQRFEAAQDELAEASEHFRLSGSLYLTRKGRTNRTTLTFWGDLNEVQRMDLQAGVGAPLAYIRQAGVELTAYYPGERRAYLLEGTHNALAVLGLDLPFDLRDLAQLLAGSAAAALPEAKPELRLDGTTTVARYDDAAPESGIGALELSPDGTLLAMTGPADDPWRIDLVYDVTESGPTAGRPVRVHAVLPDARAARLRVKRLEHLSTPWPTKSLALDLPADVERVIGIPSKAVEAGS